MIIEQNPGLGQTRVGKGLRWFVGKIFGGAKSFGGRIGWLARQIEKLTNVDEWYSETDGGASGSNLGPDDDMPMTRMAAGYTPTESEEMILENWIENLFQPFFDSLLARIADVENASTLEDQLAGINKINALMCAVQQGYKGDTVGLSKSAVAFRGQIIESSFAPLRDFLQAVVDRSGVQLGLLQTLAAVNPYDTAPLAVLGANYTCEMYRTVPGTQTSAPVLKTAALTVPGATKADTATANPTQTDSQPAKRGKLIGGLILGGIAVWLLTRNRKKK